MLIYLTMIDRPEDKIKFEDIYYRYRGLMFYVANKVLWNEQDAEDAVQQAFEAIARNIKTILDPSYPQTKSYIVIITENKAIDILRARQRQSSVVLDETIGGIEIHESSNSLSNALARLPAKYRGVLLLRFDNGFSPKELCKILDMSHAATEKLIWRAKKALQHELEKEGLEA